MTFDGNHQRLPAVTDGVLTVDHWSHLEAVYEDQCVSSDLGSDNIDYDEALAASFSRAFASRTGLIFPGRYLLALLMQKRKRGNLPKLRVDRDRLPDIGFGDIDEIAS